LELDTIGDTKTAVFFIISDTDDSLNFLVSMAYTQMFNLLCEKADDKYNGRLPVHVRCLIDEMANIGQLPKLEKLMATIRSREISACLILQTQSQLKAIYKDNADTIIGNADSVLFLGGKEKTTLKDLTESLGKETIDISNTGESRGREKSYSLNNQKMGKELMSMDELISLFSIEHISKSGAKFNVEKAKWFNHEYLQQCSNERLADMFQPQLQEHGVNASRDYVVKVVGMMKERLNFPQELWDQTHYFFVAPTQYDPKAVSKRWKPGMPKHIAQAIHILQTVPFEYDAIHQALLEDYIKGNELNMGQIMNSIRLAVVGTTVGPDMITLILTIGKEETIARLQRAIDTLGEVEQ
jgi:hypothetical protein